MRTHYEVLDNPVWYALQTTHRPFAEGTASVQRYPKGTLQFLGCASPATADLNEIIPWTAPGEKLIIIGELPSLPANWTLLRELECTQMICEKAVPPSAEKKSIPVALTNDDRTDMMELITLVQPGFFFKNTPDLGRYYGIREGEKLVAVAGERTRISGWTEVSAVCTHPEHTGKGYAQQLVTHIVNSNIENGTKLYLHLLTTNERARKVYELLGFIETRAISFWEIVRNY